MVATDLQQAPESHSSRWHGRIECQQATWASLRSTLILFAWRIIGNIYSIKCMFYIQHATKGPYLTVVDISIVIY